MIFTILIILGIIGITGTLWMSSASLRYAENPIPRGDEWWNITPEGIESSLGNRLRESSKNLIKKVLIWLIGIYRNISKKVTVKQTIKKKVREFLYEHTPDGERHPSDFWSRVKTPRKRSRRTQIHHETLHHGSPQENLETPITDEKPTNRDLE